MIKRETVDEIISTARVEDVVGDYVNLKRRGANMLGLCPFHNEKTPSFTVSPAKNLYKCFGCGKGGGAVSFLMEHENFTYPEALRHLAQKYNIRIEEEEMTDEQVEAQKERESLLIINEMSAKYFQQQLLETQEGQSIGLSYFKHRGLLASTIKQFGLGFSSRESKAYLSHATEKGYKVELLQQLGLVSASGYDFFRERVIFPFYNLSGKVIGFGGRILKDNVKAPKYLNSPESKIYNKRKTLYGLYQAKGEIRKKGVCILVEGYTDVLSLSQNDIKNVVASSGTSLTPDQVRLIKRFADDVLVLYDGDAAGQKAAIRGLNIFLEYDVNVKLVTLPEGHDPDSYVRELGATAFAEYLVTDGKDFVLTLANNIESEFKNDPVQKSIQIRDLTQSIALINNQIKRSLYVKQCATILSIDESSLFAEINKVIRKELNKKKANQYSDYNRAPNPPQPIPQAHIDYEPQKDHSQGIKEIVDHTDYQENKIAEIIINHGHNLCTLESRKEVDVIPELENIKPHLKTPLVQSVIENYILKVRNDLTISSAFWTEHEDEDVRKYAVDVLADKYTYANWSGKGYELQTQKPLEENYLKDFTDTVGRFISKRLQEKIEELDKLIKENTDETKTILFLTARKKYEDQRKELTLKNRRIVL